MNVTYILIVLWFGDSASWGGKAAIAVEFNNKAACLAAANEIRNQEKNYLKIGTILCAKKD